MEIWAKTAMAAKATIAAADRMSKYRLLGPRMAGMATIFVLHRVIREDDIVLDRRLAISERFLEIAVDHVIRRGYDVMSIGELYNRIQAQSLVRPAVVFTFDDGYRDNGTIASRVFERQGVQWSLYLTTGFPDRTCCYWWGALEQVLLKRQTFDLELPGQQQRFYTASLSAKRAAYHQIKKFGLENDTALSAYLAGRYGVSGQELLAESALSWAEIRELLAGGLLELGGHTISHPLLTQLGSEDARREIAGCRSRIHEMTGIDVSHFAHPYGAATERDYEIARQEGFKTVIGTASCNLFSPSDNLFQVLPRIRLDGQLEKLWQLDAHLSGLTGLWSRLSSSAAAGSS